MMMLLMWLAIVFFVWVLAICLAGANGTTQAEVDAQYYFYHQDKKLDEH